MDRDHLINHLVRCGVSPTDAAKISLATHHDFKLFADELLMAENARLAQELQMVDGHHAELMQAMKNNLDQALDTVKRHQQTIIDMRATQTLAESQRLSAFKAQRQAAVNTEGEEVEPIKSDESAGSQ